MKTAAILTLAILAQATGNTLLSKGMKGISSGGTIQESVSPALFLEAAGNPFVWMGTFCLAVFFALYSLSLSWEDLSLVLPATSMGYVVNVAFAYYFLHEPVSLSRWMGTGLIVAGVVLVSRSAAGRNAGITKEILARSDPASS